MSIKVSWESGYDRLPRLQWDLEPKAFAVFEQYGMVHELTSGENVIDQGRTSDALFLVPDHFLKQRRNEVNDLRAEVTRLAKEETERVQAVEKKAEELSLLVDALDERLNAMADGYDELVAFKEAVQRELHAIVRELAPDYGQRELLYCLVDSRAQGVVEMSELLDLRKAAVERMLADMAEHQRFVKALMTNMGRM